MELNEARKMLSEFIRTKNYEALCVFVNNEINELHKQIEVVKEPIEIGRLQGKLKTMRMLLQLDRELINL